MSFDDIINISPYSLDSKEKEKMLTERLLELTAFHRRIPLRRSAGLQD